MIVVFIGAGNLATQLSQEMRRVGMTVGQVYNRTADHARVLAKKLRCDWTDNLADVRKDADLYVFALKDTALQEIIPRFPSNDGLWVHTAGSMPMDVFEGYTCRYGVMYPLQTFSKEREIRLDEVPFFLESNTEEVAQMLRKITGSLTNRILFLSSEKRKSLHLAAVFACNFVNHMYSLAWKVLESEEIPADVLLPLIEETAAKVHAMPPALAQTGPAVRYDENVMGKHLDMLTDPMMKDIYSQISNSIHKLSTHE